MATWELEQSKVKKLERQIEACTLKASMDGMLVLANDPSRFFGGRPQIEEGATVRERQKIFSVIDLERSDGGEYQGARVAGRPPRAEHEGENLR